MPDEQEVTVDSVEMDVEAFAEAVKEEEEKKSEKANLEGELEGDANEKELEAELEPEGEPDLYPESELEPETMYTSFHSSQFHDPNNLSTKGMIVLGCVAVTAGGVVAAILGTIFSK